MTQTFRDWGTLGAVNTAPDIDLTELPARLGSPVTIRKSGRVYVYDPFDNLVSWLSAPGTGSIVTDPNFSMRSGSSVKMACGNTNASLTRSVPLITFNRAGLELTFAPDLACDSQLSMQITAHLGTGFLSSMRAGLVYDFSNNNLTTIAAVPATITTYDYVKKTPPVWINMKIICDLDPFVIRRVLFNELTVDMSSPMLRVTGSGKGFEIILKSTKVTSTAAPLWMEDFIFTLDEP